MTRRLWLIALLAPLLMAPGDYNVPFRPRAAAGGGVSLNPYSILVDAINEVASGDCGTTPCAFLSDSADWTVEFAFKSTGGNLIWRTGVDAGTTGASKIRVMQQINGGGVGIMGAGANHQPSGGSWDTTLQDGSWHFITFVYDSVDDECRTYMDGTIDASLTADPCPFDDSNASADLWSIGNTLLDNDFSTGKITEVRVWNVVRSATEIANHDRCQLDCADGSEACPTGLQVYWPFIEGSGTNVDEKAHGTGTVDLTLSNSNLWVTNDSPFGGWTNDNSNDCQ